MNSADESGFAWASEQDQMLAQRDSIWYGTVYLTRDRDGLIHRVDPSTIMVAHAQEPQS